MSLYSYYRISKPSVEKVSKQQVRPLYRRLRNRTFWGDGGLFLFYVCIAFNDEAALVDEGIFRRSTGDHRFRHALYLPSANS